MERAGSTDADRSVLARRERPLTVSEYHQMAEAGILGEDDPVELLDGRLLTMSPIGPAHLHCVNRLTELLSRRVYGRSPAPARISVQNPIRLSATSEPESDLALLDPDVPQDRTPRPHDTLLVIEVTSSEDPYDRTVKAAHYAQSGIPAYWIVDLSRDCVDVYEHPVGDAYNELLRFERDEDVPLPSPLAADPLPVREILGVEDR